MDDHHFSYIKFLKKKKGKNKNKNPKDLWTYVSAMLTRSRDNNQPGGWGPKSGSKFLRPTTYREMGPAVPDNKNKQPAKCFASDSQPCRKH
jgi:hypothetical protein